MVVFVCYILLFYLYILAMLFFKYMFACLLDCINMLHITSGVQYFEISLKNNIFTVTTVSMILKKVSTPSLFFSGIKIVDRNINIYLKMKNRNDNLSKYIFRHWLFIWIENGRWLQTKPCGTTLLFYFDRLISHCVVPLLSSFLCFFPPQQCLIP